MTMSKYTKLLIYLNVYQLLYAITISSIICQQPEGPLKHENQVFRSEKIDADIYKFDIIVRSLMQDLIKEAIKAGSQNSRNETVIELPVGNRRIVHCFSKSGFFLAITKTGKVSGNINMTEDTKMELQVISPRVKRIKSVSTGRYIAINENGKVVSKTIADLETLLYEEQMEDLTTTYSSLLLPKSKRAPKWYIGLYTNKNRKVKVRRASRTLPGDTATRFFILTP